MLDKNVCVEILGAYAEWNSVAQKDDVFLKIHICVDGEDSYKWVLDSEVPDGIPVSKSVLHGISNIDISLAEKLSAGMK